MNKLILVVVLVAACFGCKKNKGSSADGGGAAAVPSLDVAAAQAQAMAQVLGVPDAGSAANWTPGALKKDVDLEPLGIKVAYPENVALAVEGGTAKFTADGFYPVTISVEKLTLENAELTVTVNGVPQLSPGRTSDGKASVIQTECLLIKCTV
jgi:hypothetical protein